MVLESLTNPFRAEKAPWMLFFFGLFFSSIAIFLSLWIFKSYSSVLLVFFTVLAAIPLVYNTIRMEETKDLVISKEKKLLREHSKALSFLMLFFLGVTLSISIWYVALPSNTVSTLFRAQTETIVEINSNVTGNFTESMFIFTRILLNNMKVMIFSILFAFIYGIGSLFILTWNASVIGVALGNFVRVGIANSAASFGFAKTGAYFHIFALGLLRYMIHGIPEILAYFVAGFAGAILSVAIIRHDYNTKKFEKVILDSANLLIIAIGLLVFAAFLEVFVTPIFF
ncbi:stage II sporulation protein M [Candidatus Woesearchaeota archaeon]|nr:MAG: stage II sporulation protein M [Candidatus Woesearchaeota archaeon]